MPIKYEYNPDGSIKSAISVDSSGMPRMGSDDTQMPLPGYMYGKGGMMLGTMPKATPGVMTELDRARAFGGNFNAAVKAAAESIRNMENPKFDTITGQQGQRTLDDFKDLPILFIDNWDEISVDFLNKKYNEMLSRSYDPSKMKISYWEKRIGELLDE